MKTTGEHQESGQVRGGQKRMEQLDANERKDLARAGAEARWGIRATHTGVIKIGSLQIPCAVLENKRRVVSINQIATAFGRRPGGRYYQKMDELWDTAKIPAFLRIKALVPYITPELTEALSQVVSYRDPKSRFHTTGLPAEILPLICKLWIAARDEELTPSQARAVNTAESIFMGLGVIGIIGLVDEATGYERERDRAELQQFLDRFLKGEASKWVRRFPVEFFKEIFRLRKWEWRGNKRPGVVARYINNFVYQRLAPGVLEELQIRNPMQLNGRRKHAHHSHLSDDLGCPELDKLLFSLIGLMRAADDWEQAVRMIDRAHPKVGHQLAFAISG